MKFTIIDPARHSKLMELRAAEYAEKMRKKMSHELGFVPKIAYTDAVRRHRLFVACVPQWYNGCWNWRIVGSVYFALARPTARIYQLVVSSTFRQKGAGRKLTQAVENAARTHGCQSVRCRVRDQMIANGFWHQIGYANNEIDTTKTIRKLHINAYEKMIGAEAGQKLFSFPNRPF